MHMADSENQRGTYFVASGKSKNEVSRLVIQDKIVTAGMGGVLPEQPDPARFRSVLDVGCGTGGWLLDVAQTYSSIPRLVGVDINREMIEYARKQAQERGLSDRIEFKVMDSSLMSFPPNDFDLINQRFGDSYLRTWDWPDMMRKYVYFLKRGGTLRLTEAEHTIKSNSPALTRLFEIGVNAFILAGHSFYPRDDGVTSELPHLLHRFGFQHIDTRAHFIDYRAGTEEGEQFAQDMEYLFKNAVPFYKKRMVLPDDFDQVYAQAQEEMRQPGFVATHILLTAWGTNALKSNTFPRVDTRSSTAIGCTRPLSQLF